VIDLCEGDDLRRSASVATDAGLEAALDAPERVVAALETGVPRTYGPLGKVTSAMSLPLTARGTRFGVMSIGVGDGRPPFGHAQLTLALDLAQRAALAVDGARQFVERSHVAQTLQEALLPRALPQVPGVALGVRYVAAGSGVDVGGDFYDVFDTGDGGWGVVVGDVVGKGVEAAAVAGVARHTLRALALHERRPEALLAGLNQTLLREAGPQRMCTVCYVRLVPAAGRDGALDAAISLAGHPEPVLVRAGGATGLVGRPGTLLGAFPDVDLSTVSVRLEPGDALVLYTDGVTERHGGGNFFVTGRLRRLLRGLAGAPADVMAAEVERAVVGFRPDAPRDDLAVLVVRAAG
jgi:serine phosphatase RsbU (regulator of sigma subunit)